MSELVKRALFGAVYVGVIVATLLLKNVALFLSLFSLFIFIGIWEYETMFQLNRTRPLRKILDGLAGVYFFIATYLAISGAVEVSTIKLFFPYLTYLLFIFVRAIYSDREIMPEHLAKVIFGQVYVAGLFTCSIPLYHGFLGELILLFIFACIWLNDSGAYLFGVKFGKRRLFPSVSPKKSWEGFFGGLATVLVFSVIVSLYIASKFSFFMSHKLSDTLILMFVGLVISIASTWGDLFESMLKRSVGVKDSGKIIPGHGGVLDRLDSFMFAAPAILILYLYSL